ncbi:MAG: hypothetical protein NTX79_05900 [Candidatus Micrarchaeota archaeon]|nr:hypothetical protein [Candidatus Micrarchaeota archaeon]
MRSASVKKNDWRDTENKDLQFDIMNPRRFRLTKAQAKEKMVYAMACDRWGIRIARHFARKHSILEWFDAKEGFAREFREKYPHFGDEFDRALKNVKAKAENAKANPPIKVGTQLECTIAIGVHDSFDFSSYFYKFDQKVDIFNEKAADNYNSLIAAMNETEGSRLHEKGCKCTYLPSSMDILNPPGVNISIAKVKEMIAGAILSGKTVLEIARYFAIQNGILGWFNAPVGLACEIGKISPEAGESFTRQLAAFDKEYYPHLKQGTRFSWKIEIRGNDIPTYGITHYNAHILDQQMADAYCSLFSIMTQKGHELNGW